MSINRWNMRAVISTVDIEKSPSGMYVKYEDYAEELSALKAQRDELLAVLNKLRRDHATCEDSWYSCPKSGECLNKDDGDRCTCGADEHNAIIEAAIAHAERPAGC